MHADPAIDGARGFVLRQAGLDPRVLDARGHADVRLALIDGAVDRSHPALRGARIETVGSPSPIGASAIAATHATFCASILTGRGAGRTLGLCARGTLVNCVAVDAPMLAGLTPLPAVSATLAAAVLRALRLGCRTIVFGIEIRHPASTAWRALRDALAVARGSGATTVLPAGNRAGVGEEQACAWPEAVVVGSLDARGRPSPFSPAASCGPGAVFAPGEDIPGASADGSVTMRSGTSFAAAIVAGVLGLATAHGPADRVLPRLFASPGRRLDAHALPLASSTSTAPREIDDAATTLA